MRIVFLSASAQLGGAERVLLDVLATLCAAKPAWSLRLIVNGDGPLGEAARALGVETESLTFSRGLAAFGDAAGGPLGGDRLGRWRVLRGLGGAAPGAVRYIARLRRRLRMLAPDVVHTNGFKMHIAAAWAAPRTTRVVWHLHDYARLRPVAGRLLSAHARRCSVAVANSRSVAADFESLVGQRAAVRVIYNGIDLERFSPDGSALDLDVAAGLPPAPKDTIRIGLLATMARWKGHDVFLDALARLPRTLPVRGYVIGGPVYETVGSQWTIDELRRLAHASGIGDRVGFTGFMRESAAALRALDVVVHASVTPEPFGLVIAEAMGCGRAIVVSDAGGAAEVVDIGVEALGHPPGDAAALAACMTTLVGDPGLRAALGKSARAAAEHRFDRAQLAQHLAPLYEELAAR